MPSHLYGGGRHAKASGCFCCCVMHRFLRTTFDSGTFSPTTAALGLSPKAAMGAFFLLAPVSGYSLCLLPVCVSLVLGKESSLISQFYAYNELHTSCKIKTYSN